MSLEDIPSKVSSTHPMRLTGDRNQCRGCGAYFNSTTAFDKHRVTDSSTQARRCLSDTEKVGRGMVLRDSGFWVATEMPREALAIRKGTA